MALTPYLTVLQDSLAASGTATLSRQIPDGQTWRIKGIRQKSTGAFSFTNIRDALGRNYSNVSPSNTLPQDFIMDIADANNGMCYLNPELVISGGNILYIDIVDTSAAPNTVIILLEGELDTGA